MCGREEFRHDRRRRLRRSAAPEGDQGYRQPAGGRRGPARRGRRARQILRSTCGSSPRSNDSTGISRSSGAGRKPNACISSASVRRITCTTRTSVSPFASGAHAICEKPLVINPWNLDALRDLEEETGRRVYTVLQLRLHPELMALRDSVRGDGQCAARRVSDLLHVTRPMVRRVVEGLRGTIRRHRHQHRHPPLRPAAVAVRVGHRLGGPFSRRPSNWRVSGARTCARALVPLRRRRRPAVRCRAGRQDHVPVDNRGRAGDSSSATALPTSTRASTRRCLPGAA